VTDAVSVSGLAKKYVLGQARPAGEGLRHVIEESVRAPARWLRADRGEALRKRRREEFWALEDVSFSVAPGEAVGVIGRNGAGKSTLLKLLSRIAEPTRGEIRYLGRLASLLEVGTGFHPELTGRENIYLNAAILGMKRADINRRFDEIVAFSEVEKFLDTPVKRYSSGMYVRLAFSVAAHIEPDILLIDEVLAVGDAAFQKKCLGRMGDVVQEGRTVLFVSHNMAAVSALCSRAILMNRGRLEHSGAPETVIAKYLDLARADAEIALADRKDRQGEGRVRFTHIKLVDRRGEPVDTVSSGEDVAIEIDYDLPGGEPLKNAVVQIKFAGTMGQPLFACLSSTVRDDALALRPGGRLVCRIPKLPLGAGVYTGTVWCNVGGVLEDLVRDAVKLTVAEGDFFGSGKLPPATIGDFLVDHAWDAE
jgi:lipopolysaccharide transport system ATP-binding protein